MGNFSFLNYWTEYSCEGSYYHHDMKHEVCFSAVFPNRSCKQDYVIRIYQTFEKLDKNYSNFCPFTIQQIRRHINECKKVVPFKFSVMKDGKHKNRIEVKVHIDGPGIYHRFILTWIRYLYEYPYNMFMRDAWKLKELSPFCNDNIFNLMNLVGASLGHCGTGHTIGSLNRPQNRMTIPQLASRLSKLGGDGIHYMGDEIFGLKVNTNVIEMPYKDDWNSFWNTDDRFENAIETYKKNYKILKKK